MNLETATTGRLSSEGKFDGWSGAVEALAYRVVVFFSLATSDVIS